MGDLTWRGMQQWLLNFPVCGLLITRTSETTLGDGTNALG